MSDQRLTLSDAFITPVDSSGSTADSASFSASPAASASLTPSTPPAEPISCTADEGFQQWLSQAGGAVAISTYQAGKVVLLSWTGNQISVLLRHFDKPMGLAVENQRLALATRHEVLLFADAPLLAPGYLADQPGRYDALYLPRAAYFTGDLNVHDLGWGEEGLWLVNTRFSCLAALSQEFSFVPRWQPPFISELVPEDRCHLNGLAMVAGEPRYVTALGESNEVGGWREHKATGGILIDVERNEILRRGLSMPHSPLWHNGQLWVLNSGAGELLRVEPATGATEVVCRLPGFLRGLVCVGNHALVGLCQIRERHIFGGLPVQERYKQLICGVALVDLTTGHPVGLLQFTTGCEELYGIQFLAGRQRPSLLRPDQPARQQAFPAPDFAYWLRPGNQMTD